MQPTGGTLYQCPRFRSELNRRIRAGPMDAATLTGFWGITRHFFCSVLIFPVGEMLGRAVSHDAWTLMERARTVPVIQRERAYPSRAAGLWKFESLKLLCPHLQTHFGFFPIRLSSLVAPMKRQNAEMRYNEKQ